MRRLDLWFASGPRLALVGCLAAGAANAADFDGSRPLVCAASEVHDCIGGRTCTIDKPGNVGAPSSLRVDVGNKVITRRETTSPISSIDKTEDQLVLQGAENGFGWTLVLDQADGAMSATLVDANGAYVLFGSCTPA
jgi:hypothetical protein